MSDNSKKEEQESTDGIDVMRIVLAAIFIAFLLAYFARKKYKEELAKAREEHEKLDKEIFQIVHSEGESFLNTSNDHIKQAIVEQLLYIHRILPNRLVQTYELVNSIKYLTGVEISVEQLRIHIRDIRYSGVMVVSILGKSGYKLASNREDIIFEGRVYFVRGGSTPPPGTKKG